MFASRDERKAGWILLGIALSEGAWCAANFGAGPSRFMVFLGFRNTQSPLLGWLLALVVAALFIGLARRLPSVRANLFAPSALKVLALAVAVSAGICEEAVFRKFLMDAMQRGNAGILLQVAASALAFGLVHGVWGFIRGSVVAGVGATVATGALGAGLALVYVASGRSLAPCIAAHFLINALAEPGLVLAAVRGEMSRSPA